MLLATLGVVLFTALKLNQWFSLGVGAELGDFEARLYTTLHGGFLQVHLDGRSFLGEHFSPVLLLLVPLYAMIPSPLTLLAVQALAGALAVVPLHLLAVRVLGNRPAALAIGAAYLVSRTLSYGLMYDFHMEIFYPLLFFTAFLALEEQRWALLFGSVLLAAACKEDATVAIAGLGLYLAARGFPVRGFLLAAGALAWLAGAILLVIPAFRGAEYAFLTRYWTGYGRTQPEILRGMLDPLRHARLLFAPAKLGRMFDLFACHLFLPLVHPVAASFLVVPSWLMLYSTDNPYINGPIVYYGLLITPFLFYATLQGIRRLARSPRWTTALALGVMAVQLGNSRLFRQLSPDAWGRYGRYEAAKALIAGLPRDAEVSAQVNLVSHLRVERDRYCFPDGLERSGWALIDTIGYAWPLSPERNRAMLDSLERAGDWKRSAARDGFVLLRRSDPAGLLPSAGGRGLPGVLPKSRGRAN